MCWCDVFAVGLDSLCAPFLYLNFNDEGKISGQLSSFIYYLTFFLILVPLAELTQSCYYFSSQLLHMHACRPSYPNIWIISSWRTTRMWYKVRWPFRFSINNRTTVLDWECATTTKKKPHLINLQHARFVWQFARACLHCSCFLKIL